MKAIVNKTVADVRIQRLNEIKSVKMSAIWSEKRPAAKKDKEVANWVIENWDNFKALDNVDGNDIGEEIYRIISSRLRDFKSKTVKDIIDDKNLKLTEKELTLVVYLNYALRSYFGEIHSDIDCNDIAKDLKWNVKTVKGVVGSLVKKKVLGTYDTGTGYDVVHFVGQSDMSCYHFKADGPPVPTKAEKKPKAEADKKVQTVKKEAKTARKVGDIHPKHSTWIWTEYTKGKFDWRAVKNSVDSAKVVEAEVPKESKAKTSTKKDFLINTEKTLTEEQCKTWWEHFGKEQDIAVINQWSYLMGKIGSCSVSIRNSKTGKSKDFSKHPDWRPLAHYSYSVRGWGGEYIKIEGYCQSWEEILKSCSSTENMTFYIQKHPHQ